MPGFVRCIGLSCLSIAAGVATSCGSDIPSSPSPTPRSLTVIAVATGTQYQGNAVAGFADGSTRDVTG